MPIQPLKLRSASRSTTGSQETFAIPAQARKIVPAVSVAVVRRKTVLLVKRARPPSQGLYAYPGGKVEPGETLAQAAARELKEETGLEARNYRPLREIHIDGSGENHAVDYLLTVFGALYVGGEPVASDDAETAAFYTLAEMAEMPLAGDVFSVAEDLLGPAQDARR
ncbi:NUDIX hydrolase [Mesorhizobium sp. ORS 3324]|nr:NUDIX hydrolase [Mesorhizobium sp. ORS 3324]